MIIQNLLDPATENVPVSVRTSGAGTIAGLAHADEASSVFELQIAGPVTAGLFLDGDGLYDGSTRQLDAVFVPEPGMAIQLLCGVLGLASLGSTRSGARRS